MSTSNIDSYTFKADLDPTISNFFIENNLSAWTFKNFYNYYITSNPNAGYNNTLIEYKSNIKKILGNKDIDQAVRSRAGQIKRDSIDSFSRKGKAIAYITNNISTKNGTVVGANYGKITINNNGSREKNEEYSRKKTKINHTDEDSCWKVEDEEDIWDAWHQYLDRCNHHNFCLEKQHTIECGYSIRCNPSIPEELYSHLEIDDHTIASPFQECNEYTQNILNAMKTSNLKAVQKAVATLNNSSLVASYVHEFFSFCLTIIKKPDLFGRLSINEANFNHVLIWPLMELAVDTVTECNLNFIPGEFILNSSNEEYKADACIVYSSEYIEVCLLETSGKFLLNDNPKFGYDHIKGTFGALSMLNKIMKKYYWAKEETALKLHISFIHARYNKVHLWSLELCSKKLYALKKVYMFKVPETMSNLADVLALGNFIWYLKFYLERTAEVIKEMKKEHEDYGIALMMGNEDGRASLVSLVNQEIQKPIQGSGYGLLLPKEKDEDEVSVHFVPVDS